MSLGLAHSARGAGRPHAMLRITAHSAKGANDSNPNAAARPTAHRQASTGEANDDELGLLARIAELAARTQAHAAISGRNAVARPARIDAISGRHTASAAKVARAVASAVSMPLTAWAAIGTESA